MSMSTAISTVNSRRMVWISLPGNSEEQSRRHTGSLALHGMRGMRKTAARAAPFSFMLPAAVMAGTAHPNPIIRGVREAPERPSLFIKGSARSARSFMARLSLIRERQKKSTAMVGAKASTPDTPGITPSAKSSLRRSVIPEAAACR